MANDLYVRFDVDDIDIGRDTFWKSSHENR